MGNTTKSRCLGVRVEAQANGKEVWINKEADKRPQIACFQTVKDQVRVLIMGLETSDPHSQKEHTEIHKIPKFGVNQASFD